MMSRFFTSLLLLELSHRRDSSIFDGECFIEARIIINILSHLCCFESYHNKGFLFLWVMSLSSMMSRSFTRIYVALRIIPTCCSMLLTKVSSSCGSNFTLSLIVSPSETIITKGRVEPGSSYTCIYVCICMYQHGYKTRSQRLVDAIPKISKKYLKVLGKVNNG